MNDILCLSVRYANTEIVLVVIKGHSYLLLLLFVLGPEGRNFISIEGKFRWGTSFKFSLEAQFFVQISKRYDASVFHRICQIWKWVMWEFYPDLLVDQILSGWSIASLDVYIFFIDLFLWERAIVQVSDCLAGLLNQLFLKLKLINFIKVSKLSPGEAHSADPYAVAFFGCEGAVRAVSVGVLAFTFHLIK